MRVELFKAHDRPTLRRKLHEKLNTFAELFPSDRKARILVKPNLNSNLDSLTGNTTDLRVLADVVAYVKDAGYADITIAEGYNSGFHRDGISVIVRNRVDRLADHFGVKVVDLNYAQGRTIEFEDGIRPQAAREVFEADFFINVPKLKMHYETLMTVCLKSLMGTLVGRQNKTLTHKSLVKNILRINDAIRPHLQVVDAMVAMEGTGPSAGTPLRMDTVFVGDDPYVTDLVAARLFSCAYDEVPLLREALRTGRIQPSMVEYANALDLDEYVVKARRPHPNFVARLVVNPKYQKYFIAVRNAPVIKQIVSNVYTKKLLLRLGLTQEIIVKRERSTSLSWNESRCGRCGRCAFYCPLENPLPDSLAEGSRPGQCIDCLYCFAVCPRDAIRADGELGFYSEQMRRYGALIKKES